MFRLRLSDAYMQRKKNLFACGLGGTDYTSIVSSASPQLDTMKQSRYLVRALRLSGAEESKKRRNEEWKTETYELVLN